MIKSIPIKPIKTAIHRLIPTFSDRNKIDAMVTKIGPPNVNETTSAKGKFLKPKKMHINATVPEMALKACKPGLDVL